MSSKHAIVAVARARKPGCRQCDETHPHNIIVRCLCGELATGKTDHIWTFSRISAGTLASQDILFVSLNPSFNWQPYHPVHEFVQGVPLLTLRQLHDDKSLLFETT